MPGRVPGLPTALTFVVLGALLGVFVFHPLTMVIYWFEFHRSAGLETSGLWRFVAGRMGRSFTLSMLPMSGLFALLGACLGIAFAAFQRALSKRERATRSLREQLARDLPLIVAGGETEKVEFKSSVRDIQSELSVPDDKPQIHRTHAPPGESTSKASGDGEPRKLSDGVPSGAEEPR